MAERQHAANSGRAIVIFNTRFKPVLFITYHHQSGLIVQRGKVCADFELESKISLNLSGKDMTGKAFKPVPGFAPEISFVIGGDL